MDWDSCKCQRCKRELAIGSAMELVTVSGLQLGTQLGWVLDLASGTALGQRNTQFFHSQLLSIDPKGMFGICDAPA